VKKLPYCETCGAQLISGVSFCSNCGSKVGQTQARPPQQIIKRGIPIRTILIVAVVFLAGVAAGSYLGGPSPSQNQILTPIVSVSVSPTTFTVLTTAEGGTSVQITTTTLHQTTTYSTTHVATSSATLYTSATTYRPTSTARSNCDPSYPTVCIPPPPPDLDCKDIPYRNFVVLPPDPHHFDGDGDGIGCET